MELEGTFPCSDTDDELQFTLVQQCNSLNPQITVDFYDFDSGTYLDARQLSSSTSDSTNTFHVDGSLGTFFVPTAGSNRVKTRVRVHAVGATSVPEWQLWIDFAGWHWSH